LPLPYLIPRCPRSLPSALSIVSFVPPRPPSADIIAPLPLSLPSASVDTDIPPSLSSCHLPQGETTRHAELPLAPALSSFPLAVSCIVSEFWLRRGLEIHSPYLFPFYSEISNCFCLGLVLFFIFTNQSTLEDCAIPRHNVWTTGLSARAATWCCRGMVRLSSAPAVCARYVCSCSVCRRQPLPWLREDCDSG
jgi:hypothetical protein